MRVLYLTDSLSDLDGVGRYAMRLIAALEALRPGFEPRVLLARKHRPTSAAVPEHWDVSVGLPPDYFYYMSPLRFAASFALGARQAVKKGRSRGGVDLVHAIKDYPHNLVALRAAERLGVPCVATAHGTYSVVPLLSSRHAARARRTYARLDGMIAVSSYTAGRLRELTAGGGAPRRLITVPNAVDAAHYRAPRQLAGERPWHAGPYVLTIGELKERKGIHLALEAFCRVAPRFPGLQHFIVGKSSGDDYQRGLEARAAAAGLGERVHLLGNISEDEKVDLLQRAAVFLHTPVQSSDGGFEGFGIVYLEASAAGVAAIGTTGCGAEDAIVQGETGTLVAPHAEAVAAALAHLLGDESLRARMGRAGREHAARSSWERNAREVLALYDEVLA
jgi:phosphatidylinositol alpha-1,6-mannosyltransferase